MREVVRRPPSLTGSIAPPGDKSVSHRALILNSIATGTARVSGLSSGSDIMSIMRCLRNLGVRIEPDEKSTVTVYGSGGRLEEPGNVLDTGNSGTSMRLLAGLLAAQPFLSVLTGDGSLRTRPMARIAEPLRLMGTHILGRNNGNSGPSGHKRRAAEGHRVYHARGQRSDQVIRHAGGAPRPRRYGAPSARPVPGPHRASTQGHGVGKW